VLSGVANADFSAAFAEREDFCGVQAGVGIEGVMNAAHQSKIRIAEDERHEFGFLHANAMLAGQGATDFHAVADNFVGSGQRAFEFSWSARIVEDQRMQIAVSGMENISNLQIALFADLVDAAKRLREFGPRNYAVQNVITWRDTPQSTEGVFAALPE
jgi:hypothetical protein